MELWHASMGRKLYDFTYDELKARVPKIAKIIDEDAALVARGDSPGDRADISEVIKCINDEYDSEIKKWRQYKIASNKDIEPLISELNSDREKILTKYKALVPKNRINYPSPDYNAVGMYKRMRHSAFDGALYHSFDGALYKVKTK